jgi:Flp pilus assembly protein TadG
METNQLLRKRRQRGNALLEAALATPVLFLILCGVVDFGRAFYFTDIAAGSARAGTQYGMISSANAGNTAGMEQAAREEAAGVPSSIFSAAARFYCQNSDGSAATCSDTSTAEEYVEVVTHIKYSMLIPWPGLGGSCVISGNTVPACLDLGGISVVRVQ